MTEKTDIVLTVNAYLKEAGLESVITQPFDKKLEAIHQAAFQSGHEEGHKTGFQEGKSQSFEAGRKAEKDRVTAILRSAEAEKRLDQAMVLALDETLAAESAKRLLATMPTQDQQRGMTEFEKHMAKNSNGDLHADMYEDDEPLTEGQEAKRSWEQSINRVHAPPDE